MPTPSPGKFKSDRRVARPLKELVTLIKQDLEDAEFSALPYYRAAGEKLLEAKSQLKHGEFKPWIERNFKKPGYRECCRYMALVKNEKGHSVTFESLNEALRQARKDRKASKARMEEALRSTFDGGEFKRLRDEACKRQEENAARHDRVNQIINAGYRVLAGKAHPDKGGSDEAMRLLNEARDYLRLGRAASGSAPQQWWTQTPDMIARQMATHMTPEGISHLFALAMDALKAKQQAKAA
jgi:hypothetical protein